MKSFFKMFMASLTAIFVSMFLLFVLSVAFINIVAALLSSTSEPTIKENTVLHIKLDSPIVESPDINPFSTISPLSLEISRPMVFFDILSSLECAANDKSVKGIFLNLTNMVPMSLSTIEELRNAVIEFKSSGKFVISFSESYSLGSYYLASVADKIYLNPIGSVDWKGIAMQSLYFKDALSKLEIQPEIIKHGKYKSAAEAFTENEMTPENRLQSQALVNSIWDNIVNQVSSSRSIAPNLLQQYATDLVTSEATTAVEVKMIDSLCYYSDVFEEVKGLTENSTFMSLSGYIPYAKSVISQNSKSNNKIAIIYAQGEILEGKSNDDVITAWSMSSKLNRVRNDNSVKAVVLRINSPGGSALASESIWKEVSLTQQKKPVVVSMGAYAASGGYYIAAPADFIYCYPSTITGSIGVFGMMFNAEKGFKKLGVSSSVVKSNESADLGSMFRSITPSEYKVIETGIETIYSAFIKHVAQGRNMTEDKVEQIAQGRVWSGTEAVNVGLADGCGGLKDAVFMAAEKAGVAKDFDVLHILNEQTAVQQFVAALGGVSMSFVKDNMILTEYMKIKDINKKGKIQAIMPSVPYIL